MGVQKRIGIFFHLIGQMLVAIFHHTILDLGPIPDGIGLIWTLRALSKNSGNRVNLLQWIAFLDFLSYNQLEVELR